MKQKDYTGIDICRLAAAFFIVAIHTSPLLSVSETGDFILTRVIVRLAVPFFFMTSGFFLVSRYGRPEKRIGAFAKNTARIYFAAILLYLPVNIYNGYFEAEHLLPNMIKDIIFDGTLYHLWYLPASVAGAAIAQFLLRRAGAARALAAAFLLYLAGLFGDSYYGFSEQIPALEGFYGSLFEISDYTRNGIFFAPVFFLLGGLIADGRRTMPLKKSLAGFGISFALMFAEAMALHHFQLQRHDSMYVFLLPCMYFLFHAVLQFRGKRLPRLRTLSLVIYIIHPMVILMVRLTAKAFHLQGLFVENSVVHFLAVSLLSFIFGIFVTAFLDWHGEKKAPARDEIERARIEIDLDNLEHNVKVLKKAMPPKCRLMAVVKADAYGHGSLGAAARLHQAGVRAYAVATADEGIALRKNGISGEILVLGYTDPSRAGELCRYKLSQTLIDYGYAVRLNRQGYRVKAHLKIDTGMRRLGFDADDTEKMARAFQMKNLEICGICTHLCAADSCLDEDVRFTKMQAARFEKALAALKERGISLPKTHMLSSYGFLNYSEQKGAYIRIGIALYGVLSRPDGWTRQTLDLKPVLSLKTKIVLLRKVKQGESVGYGRAFVAARDSVVAILPVGYADGIPRILSDGKGHVLISGRRAPIVGKICMDQLAVDVTDIPDVKAGMTATLIGRDGGEEITADQTAARAGSISNELLSRLGSRLAVVTTGR